MFSPYYATLGLVFQLWYWVVPQSIATPPFRLTCLAIRRAVPNARVSYPGSESYEKDNFHWLPSSSAISTCSVEPSSVEDVSKLIRILGKTRTPFAIKAGGRATNPGFSSTPGVQIALSAFNKVDYNKAANTATVGAGLPWSDIYGKLQPLGVTVVGGRIVGVGMAGVTLGGGYSYTSNRHGLTIDHIVGYQLVLPNGEITWVTAKSNPELLFGLKGGYNNFGIVTNFVFETYPLGLVWGGLLAYSGDSIDPVVRAVADFQESNSNIDATVVAVYTRDPDVVPSLSVAVFYNGTTPPAGLFEPFTAIKSDFEDLKTRTYTDLITLASTPFLTNKLRGAMHTVSLTDLSQRVIYEILQQTDYYYDGEGAFTKGASFVAFIEPFIPTGGLVVHTNHTAFPHNKFFTPLSILWRWPDEKSDHIAQKDMKLAAAAITRSAKADGQQLDDIPIYSDYALADTPIETLYTVNLPYLAKLAKKYDPLRIMRLTGGFHF